MSCPHGVLETLRVGDAVGQAIPLGGSRSFLYSHQPDGIARAQDRRAWKNSLPSFLSRSLQRVRTRSSRAHVISEPPRLLPPPMRHLCAPPLPLPWVCSPVWVAVRGTGGSACTGPPTDAKRSALAVTKQASTESSVFGFVLTALSVPPGSGRPKPSASCPRTPALLGRGFSFTSLRG